MLNWDGIYAAYMTGNEGQGFGMFVFDRGVITGADPLGVLFSGTYNENQEGVIDGTVAVTVPPKGTVIQGVTTGSNSMTYNVPITLNSKHYSGQFFQLITPLGAVNIRFEKLTELGSPQ